MRTLIAVGLRVLLDGVGDEVLAAAYLRVVPAATHEALDRVDGVGRVGDRLALGQLADEALAGLGEGDDGGDGAAALGGRDDGGLAALHDGDDGVGRAEVDADDLAHWDCCSSCGGSGRGGRVGAGGRCASSGGRRAGCRRSRRRATGAGPGRGCDSRAGSRPRPRSRAGRCPETWLSASCSRGSNGRPSGRRSGVTPSLSRSARSLRSIAAIPSSQAVSRASAGTWSMARSKSSASATTFARSDLVGEAEGLLPLLGRAPLQVRVVGLRALGQGQVLVGPGDRGVALGGQGLDLGQERRSRSCRARRSAPRRASGGAVAVLLPGPALVAGRRGSACDSPAGSGVEVVDEVVHQAGDEADRADRLRRSGGGWGPARRRRRRRRRVDRTAPGRARRRPSPRDGSPGRCRPAGRRRG